MTVDPFTTASPTYRNAMRHPHKTGASFEGWSPLDDQRDFRRAAIAIGVVAVVLLGVAYALGVAAQGGR
ncbi:hypothetical protein [Caulobacter phage KcrB]|nr:hypothetical protein RW_GP026 [Caulobacter phage RW]WCA46330.1 hypothetical protein [Caulobacter phage KcrB]WCD56265.1 hypothetical protein [Caulobacter phage RLK]WNV48057.1 hypothetical protein GB2A_gp025 [Caulobacter phage GB2A]